MKHMSVAGKIVDKILMRKTVLPVLFFRISQRNYAKAILPNETMNVST